MDDGGPAPLPLPLPLGSHQIQSEYSIYGRHYCWKPDYCPQQCVKELSFTFLMSFTPSVSQVFHFFHSLIVLDPSFFIISGSLTLKCKFPPPPSRCIYADCLLYSLSFKKALVVKLVFFLFYFFFNFIPHLRSFGRSEMKLQWKSVAHRIFFFFFPNRWERMNSCF